MNKKSLAFFAALAVLLCVVIGQNISLDGKLQNLQTQLDENRQAASADLASQVSMLEDTLREAALVQNTNAFQVNHWIESYDKATDQAQMALTFCLKERPADALVWVTVSPDGEPAVRYKAAYADGRFAVNFAVNIKGSFAISYEIEGETVTGESLGLVEPWEELRRRFDSHSVYLSTENDRWRVNLVVGFQNDYQAHAGLKLTEADITLRVEGQADKVIDIMPHIHDDGRYQTIKDAFDHMMELTYTQEEIGRASATFRYQDAYGFVYETEEVFGTAIPAG